MARSPAEQGQQSHQQSQSHQSPSSPHLQRTIKPAPAVAASPVPATGVQGHPGAGRMVPPFAERQERHDARYPPVEPTSPVKVQQSPRQSPPAESPPPYGLGNLGGGNPDLRRRRQEEMKRALEEQIAEKERQRRLERERQQEPPAAARGSPMPRAAEAGQVVAEESREETGLLLISQLKNM